MLGDMESELNPSEFIDEFASEGPKYYAYRLITNEVEKAVCKVWGITLNYYVIGEFRGNQGHDFGTGRTRFNVHTEHKIKRKRRAGGVVDLVTEPENNRYRISFFKRRRMLDNSSVPLGYIYMGVT